MKSMFLLVLLLSIPALAQEEDPAQASTPQPCSGTKYRQFDFWIGRWNVSANGQVAGTNSIQPILNGCVLLENWQGSGVGGLAGSSFNLYDQARDRWHQTWVDGSGTLLELNGGLKAGNMVLSGERPAADGNGTTMHRITWSPNPDGSVRQLWEASSDGENWTVLFDGLYEKDLTQE